MNNFKNYLKQVNEDMTPFLVDDLPGMFSDYGVENVEPKKILSDIMKSIKQAVMNTINKYDGTMHEDDYGLYGTLLQYIMEVAHP